jgi:tetratricopeptide (TPR) repeat protein
MSWSFGTEWSPFGTVFLGGNWWYDPQDDSFGYRIGGGEEEREWADTSWEFPGPDDYPALAAEIEPGLMARAGEKAIHQALVSGDPYIIDLAAGQHPQYRATADVLAGLMSLNTRRSWAGELLDRAIASGYEPADDAFIRTYLAGAGIVVPIAPGVVVPLPLTRTAAALATAELHQAAAEYERAISTLERVGSSTHVTLSLTELLCAAERYAEAIELTDGVIQTDDVTAMTLAYRALAQGELDDHEAAAATLQAVLERGSPSEEVAAFTRVVQKSLEAA